MDNENNLPNIFRLDKNFSTNIDKLSMMAGGQHNNDLLKTIVYYISYTHQYDIFGYGTFDPQDFAKTFGLDIGNLRRKHPSPAQKENMTDELWEQYTSSENRTGDISDTVWDTYLENALYILQSKSINFDLGGTFNQGPATKSVTGIRVFEELAAHTVGNRGRYRGKILYSYKVTTEFIKNLSCFFVQVDRKGLIRAHAKRLDDLYLYIVNLKAALAAKKEYRTTPESTPAFNLLCTKAHIDRFKKNGEEWEPRIRKFKLVKAIEYLQYDEYGEPTGIEPRFTLTWENMPGTNKRYLPIFEFEPVREFDNVSLRREIFRNNLEAALLNKFRTIYRNGTGLNSKADEEDFYAWLHDTSRDWETKRAAFTDASVETFQKEPEDLDEKFRKFTVAIERNPGLKIREMDF